MIRSYKEMRPRVGSRAWVDPSAQVVGDVELGEDASVWMNAVVRESIVAADYRAAEGAA